MPTLKIVAWYARLGNNLIQLYNIIDIALYFNYNIIIPKHKYFNSTNILINNNNNDEICITDIQSKNFFYKNKIEQFGNSWKNTNDTNKTKKILNIIRNLFIYKYNTLEPLENNSLTIHIRSGDIFSNNPHPGYICPPLSYYINIINSKKYDKIYLIAEDTKNPCINLLRKIYPNIIFKISILDNDIKLILRSKNIITSFGTFIPLLLLLTDYTKTIYIPSYGKNSYYDNIHNIKKIIIELNKYRELIGKWKNNNQQRNLLINYNLPNKYKKNKPKVITKNKPKVITKNKPKVITKNKPKVPAKNKTKVPAKNKTKVPAKNKTKVPAKNKPKVIAKNKLIGYIKNKIIKICKL
jgi:hypothetical protein